MREIRNAKIRSVQLGFEDHGILTCWVNTEGANCSQGFGGYGFSHRPNKKNVGASDLADYILGILEALEIDAWEKLPGTPCRVEQGESGLLVRIGHFTKEKWFDPRILMNKRKEA